MKPFQKFFVATLLILGSASLVANAKSKNAEEPASDANESMGFIKKVYSCGTKVCMDIDYIVWLVGKDAEKYCKQQHSESTEECMIGGFVIQNDNPKIRTFPISPDAKISYISETPSKYPYFTVIDPEVFMKALNGTGKLPVPSYSLTSLTKDEPLFSVKVEKGMATELQEQYLP